MLDVTRHNMRSDGSQPRVSTRSNELVVSPRCPSLSPRTPLPQYRFRTEFTFPIPLEYIPEFLLV